MDPSIVVALIGASGAIGGSVIGYLTASKVSEYRIGELEKKVDQFSEKLDILYDLNTKNHVQDEQIKQNSQQIETILSRLSTLERSST